MTVWDLRDLKDPVKYNKQHSSVLVFAKKETTRERSVFQI